ncbi:unnamed protein product [Bathycoccus prasinos]
MSNASTSVLSSFAIRGGKSDVSRTPRGKKSSSRREQNEEDENDRTADLPPPSRAEHLILAWISINPSVKRLCGYGLEPFQEEIRFLLEGLLWREIQKWTKNEEDEEEESSLASSSDAKEGAKRVWVKGILVRAMMVFFILYPNYVVLATCAVFVRASLRARRRASLERRRNTKEKKKKKKNKEEEDVVVPRMSAYGVIVLETIADRLETIASIASGRDPLALRVACFACAWLFVLSFFVSFSAWFAAVALFATTPKGAKRVLEACFR